MSIKRNTTGTDRTKPPPRGSPGRFVMPEATALDLLASAFHHRRGETLPPLSIALQEQLGLELDSERAPVEVLVIDRIERPSEN